MILYRYTDGTIVYKRGYNGPRLDEYTVVGETHCYWKLGYPHSSRVYKRIMKNAKHPWAYAVKEYALESYIIRKRRNISILKEKLAKAEQLLIRAEEMKNSGEFVRHDYFNTPSSARLGYFDADY